ncbi:MAG: zinc ribbon domain-containing protein [Candidatus Dormibacteraeota bacterium]|nr:zinc ribbon domain-containing protein [Candidatus Dormibacteraeota bacterium]
MATVICPNCGNVNSTDNAFCTKCGAALAQTAMTQPVAGVPGTPPTPTPVAPTAPPSPAAVTPPGPQPPAGGPLPGYTPGQSAFLPPPAPGTAPPVNKTSHALLIGGIIALVVLLAGGGVAFAAIHGTSTPSPKPPAPTTAPTTAPSGQPTLQPTLQPSPSGGAGMSVDTDFATVVVPPGFTVAENTSDHVTLNQTSGSGVIIVEVVQLKGSTLLDLDNQLLDAVRSVFDSSAAPCQGATIQHTALNGANGSTFPADGTADCFTLSSENGPATKSTAGFVAGNCVAPDGTEVGCVVSLFAPSSDFQSFVSSIPSSFNATAFKATPPS